MYRKCNFYSSSLFLIIKNIPFKSINFNTKAVSIPTIPINTNPYTQLLKANLTKNPNPVIAEIKINNKKSKKVA